MSAPARIAVEDLEGIGAEAPHGRGEDFTGVSIDSRTIREGELFVAIRGPRFDGHAFLEEAFARGARGAVVDQAVSPRPGIYRVRDTTEALSDLARARRLRLGTKVVAITGSTGKTTTKEMTAALLGFLGPTLKTEGNLNNQYGLPLTLLRLEEEHKAAVLELGMSAPGEIRALTLIARPDYAVITNVAPAHLAFFPSVDAIAEAKGEILEGLSRGGFAVLNGDDPRVRALGSRVGERGLLFGGDPSFYASSEGSRATLHGTRFFLRLGGRSHDAALPLPGPHLVQNYLAAAAVAFHAGVPPEVIVERALHQKAAPHRGELRYLAEGVTLLDDSYNASPLAVRAAVKALSLSHSRKVAFLGDMLELGAQGPALHRETGEQVGPALDVLVGVGPLSQELVRGAQSTGVGSATGFSTSAAAAAAALSFVRPGDSVLVKGSRGMRMEAVAEALLARFPEDPGADADVL